MSVKSLWHWVPRRSVAGTCLLLLLVWLPLSGCMSTGPGHDDVMTDSDEPEIRKRARLRLELAVGYFQQGKPTVALDEVKKSLVIDPDFADAYSLRGLIYLQMEEYRLAEESLLYARKLNPKDGNVVHNYGWLLCQRRRFDEAIQAFQDAIGNRYYGDRAKTWMVMGLCQIQAGKHLDAEKSLIKAYELDAANPITGYNLASLFYQRGEFVRAQFYIRRINNSEQANAETLWLGIKVERNLGYHQAAQQLATQLRKRFPKSKEIGAYDRGAFHE
ncbi:MAG: type IV pilus biogenesis/stability protein PilW [Hylemonella sp.]|nr:type IV pilus biogenesis/stability protein PilW [Hylemonella sp.]MDH5708320.1 type IV pilus biogenesis/stability protein PilW [Hylemonella sp.]